MVIVSCCIYCLVSKGSSGLFRDEQRAFSFCKTSVHNENMRSLLTIILLVAPLVCSVIVSSIISQSLFNILVQIVVVLLLLVVYGFWAWQSSTKANCYTQTLEAVKDLRADLFNYSFTLIVVVVWVVIPFLDWWEVPNSLYFIQLAYYVLIAVMTGYELYVSASNSFESLRKTSEISVSSR